MVDNSVTRSAFHFVPHLDVFTERKMDPKDKKSHINSLEGNGPGSKAFERSKALIMHDDAEELNKSLIELNEHISTASKASSSLGRKVFWLNVVIAIATAVAAISTAINAYLTFFKN